MRKYNVVIVGATGLVGQELIKILAERAFPVKKLFLVSSSKSRMQEIIFEGNKLFTTNIESIVPDEIDIIFNAAPDSVSDYVVHHFSKPNNVIIDKSAVYRMKHPLILAGLNLDSVDNFFVKKSGEQGSKILAMPNCSVAFLALILYPLIQHYNISRVVITTLQSISGAGKSYLDSCLQEYISTLNLDSTINTVGTDAKPINAFDLMPIIGALNHHDTSEEEKINNELNRLLGVQLNICVTAIRVPVIIGHCATINIQFQQPIALEDVQRVFVTWPHIKLFQDKYHTLTPRNVAGTDEVWVGRLRHASCSNIINLWALSDNLRIGAALNSVKVAEYIIQNNLI